MAVAVVEIQQVGRYLVLRQGVGRRAHALACFVAQLLEFAAARGHVAECVQRPCACQQQVAAHQVREAEIGMLAGELVDCGKSFRHAALRHGEQAVGQHAVGVRQRAWRQAGEQEDGQQAAHEGGQRDVSSTMRHWPFCRASFSVLVTVEPRRSER